MSTFICLGLLFVIIVMIVSALVRHLKTLTDSQLLVYVCGSADRAAR